ncbi:DUF4834 family protein [Pseudobacter ginsenosidimutans]|uniref:Uncharacterized protein DUF4834 n=1 Tax=Pseudobacter ginsenosidimutans TaxID=661488 RepID=A0A4Q7MT12_9BACT|nr:DUF4834 family protein [Pseudobacter ginsenosidimutans]QEC41585.1 DUF4834 family protein [Pseudobacter ginsenosidimutans]RZS71628.1 uncharacterized protein DUF4834 [Pseudobacter ginsenosidimutans]
MSWKLILWIIVGYLAIRFVFRFLLPLFVVSKRMRQQVKEFHNAMNTAQQQQQAAQNNYQSGSTSAPTPNPPKEKAGDYIDFEEVK